MSKIKKYPAIDFYFHKPILCDFSIIFILWVGIYYIHPTLLKWGMPSVKIFDKPTALTYMAYITSANVTFAGFIIAALTILITVKSSLKARGFEDSENAMEYIFSTKNYYQIVKIIIKSIVELFIVFIIQYGAWLLSNSLSDRNFYKILLFSTICIIAAVFRVLYTLFKVLNLENLKRQ